MAIINRYEQEHISPKGPGDARPTAQQIIQYNKLEGSWNDKVILITGCSSGIGIETAKALASTGATLFLTARNLDKAREALKDLLAADSNSNNSPKIHLLKLDLKSLASVRDCVNTFLDKSSKLNILINNAGIRHVPFSKTVDGFESHFAVNHLSHFLLTRLLLPTLQASSSPDFASRVIAVSSTAHRNIPMDLHDLNFDRRPYTLEGGYGQSKLANVYMATEIERRYGHSPTSAVHAFAAHPGGIRTGLQQGENGGGAKEILKWYYIRNLRRVFNIFKSPEQGAATSVYAAVDKDLEGQGGYYLEDCGVSKPVKKGWGLIDPGYVAWAYDEEKAKQLWEISDQMVGLDKE